MPVKAGTYGRGAVVSVMISPMSMPPRMGGCKDFSTNTNTGTSVCIHRRPDGIAPKVVAWEGKFGHLSRMARSSKPSAGSAAVPQRASDGGGAGAAAGTAAAPDHAPLQLEK